MALTNINPLSSPLSNSQKLDLTFVVGEKVKLVKSTVTLFSELESDTPLVAKLMKRVGILRVPFTRNEHIFALMFGKTNGYRTHNIRAVRKTVRGTDDYTISYYVGDMAYNDIDTAILVYLNDSKVQDLINRVSTEPMHYYRIYAGLRAIVETF